MNRIARTTMIAAAAVGIALALTACGSTPDTAPPATTAPATFDLTGSVTITSDDGVAGTRNATGTAPKAGCFGWEGYSDLKIGAPVVAYGPDGAMVGVGKITDSISHPKDVKIDTVTITMDTCELHFTVPSVPTGLGMYSYEVTHRGKLPLTEAAATSGPVATTIG